jgi:hypothetical protein
VLLLLQFSTARAESWLEYRIRVNQRVIPLLKRACPQAVASANYANRKIGHALALGERPPYELVKVAAGRYYDCSQQNGLSQEVRDWATFLYCDNLAYWAEETLYAIPETSIPEPSEKERLQGDVRRKSEFLKYYNMIQVNYEYLIDSTKDHDLRDLAKFTLGNHIKRLEKVAETLLEQDNTRLSNMGN